MSKKSKDYLSYLTSQQTAQHYLLHCYKTLELPNSELKSYENYNAFLYYLDHGRKFYELGNKVETFAKPILYFYGLSHLLKACLLTKRPNYPESTQLLSHGVTARKRKKQNYTFMKDEVKVQQKGLFPYFSEHLFSINPIPFEKIQMEDLLSLIPEMQSYFLFQGEEKMVIVGSIDGKSLQFPIVLLDQHHLTKNAFIRRIEPYVPLIQNIEENQTKIIVQLQEKISSIKGPFFIHLNDNQLYFPLQREHFLPISEVMVHYLLLYNLSMLCRYEAEWWGDLLVSKPEVDYPFIRKFLNVTSEKIPTLIEEDLYKNVHH